MTSVSFLENDSYSWYKRRCSIWLISPSFSPSYKSGSFFPSPFLEKIFLLQSPTFIFQIDLTHRLFFRKASLRARPVMALRCPISWFRSSFIYSINHYGLLLFSDLFGIVNLNLHYMLPWSVISCWYIHSYIESFLDSDLD